VVEDDLVTRLRCEVDPAFAAILGAVLVAVKLAALAFVWVASLDGILYVLGCAVGDPEFE
tara:strand:+ start:354 stop:533 length:180 start_codon:yes stop_codon:yes gene_type:complete